MILLALFNIGYNILSFLADVIFPELPQGVSTILAYIVGMIDNGLDILGALFIDFDFVGPLCAWIAEVWLILLVVDLMWKVVGYIKLSRKN